MFKNLVYWFENVQYIIKKILINFIPFKKYRKKLKAENLPSKKKIIGAKGNYIDIPKNISCKISISGKNNSIIIGKTKARLSINININGDNNKIILGENIYGNIDCNIAAEYTTTNNTELNIGENTGFGKVYFHMVESDVSVLIGERCTFSWDIDIFPTDSHPIIDKTSNKLLNRANKITIGNHVWVGKGTTFLKDSSISNNSVVGACSVITKKFNEENIVVAGNPAKKIKDNINWSVNAIHDYI